MSGLALVALLMGAGVVVFAISGQSRATRMVHASLTLGRFAGELVSSAIDETLAEFPFILAQQAGGQNMRDVLRQKSAGGVVDGPALFDKESFSYKPQRTLDLVSQERLSVKLTDVMIRPASYNTLQNYGIVAFACQATFTLGGKRSMTRRKTSYHYFTLSPDQKTFYLHAVPIGAILDRG